MTNLDTILDGHVPLRELPKLKQDIKEYFSSVVSANVEDYMLVRKLKKRISEL